MQSSNVMKTKKLHRRGSTFATNVGEKKGRGRRKQRRKRSHRLLLLLKRKSLRKKRRR